MAEKIVPDVQDYFDSLRAETSLDFVRQRVAMLNRILNAPPQVISEVHLEEWYNQFWRLAGITAQINKLSEQEEKICEQVLNEGQRVDNLKRQFFALALILYGKISDAESLIDNNLWSKKLREDYTTFLNWRKILIDAPDLPGRARISHDRAAQVGDYFTSFNTLIENFQWQLANGGN